jgi:hypothetical protein
MGALLQGGDFAADRQSFGDDREQGVVELIDSGPEVIEFGHHVHRTPSTALRSL